MLVRQSIAVLKIRSSVALHILEEKGIPRKIEILHTRNKGVVNRSV